MGALIGLAGRYWYIIAIAVVLAFAGIQTARLGNAKRDQINPASKVKWQVEAKRDAKALSAAIRDLTTCRANTDRLTAAIGVQNAAVTAWKAEADRRAADATKAAQDARAARLTADRRASQLAAFKSAPTCPAREAAIADLVKGLTQ